MKFYEHMRRAGRTHFEWIPIGPLHVSVQAGEVQYSEPRRDGLRVERYTEFEVAILVAGVTNRYVTRAELAAFLPEDIMGYFGLALQFDSRSLSYVPVEKVEELIDIVRVRAQDIFDNLRPCGACAPSSSQGDAQPSMLESPAPAKAHAGPRGKRGARATAASTRRTTSTRGALAGEHAIR